MSISNDAEDDTISRFQEINNKVENIPKQRAIARRDDLSIVLNLCIFFKEAMHYLFLCIIIFKFLI